MAQDTKTIEAASEPTSDRLDLKVLPLTMCLYMVMLGILVTWITAWILPIQIGKPWGILGIVLLVISYRNIKWCFRLFSAANTNTNTTKPALAIVNAGPYRVSRNPMYLSYIVGYFGLGLIANSWPMLLLTPLFVYFISVGIILPEEAYLERVFGDKYLEYKKTRRRWI